MLPCHTLVQALMYTLIPCIAALIVLPYISVKAYLHCIIFALNKLPSEKGDIIDKVLRKQLEGVSKVIGGVSVNFIGVGVGSRLLNASPTTSFHLGCLSAVGLYSFFMARTIFKGWFFRFFACLAISSQLTIVAICSTHTFLNSFFDYVFGIVSLVYVGLMISWQFIEFGDVDTQTKQKPLSPGEDVDTQPETQPLGDQPETQPRSDDKDEDTKKEIEPVSDREKGYGDLAKDTIAILVGLGLGLQAVSSWGNLMEEYQDELLLLSIYNTVAYWALCGAQILERGRLFKILVLIGTIKTLSMFLTALSFIFLPDNEITIFIFSAVSVIYAMQWWLLELVSERIWITVSRISAATQSA